MLLGCGCGRFVGIVGGRGCWVWRERVPELQSRVWAWRRGVGEIFEVRPGPSGLAGQRGLDGISMELAKACALLATGNNLQLALIVGTLET